MWQPLARAGLAHLVGQRVAAAAGGWRPAAARPAGVRGRASAAASDAPEPPCPAEPGPEDCCQSGCENCVWEAYRQELKQYTDWMAAHRPAQALPGKKESKRQMVEASLDAFEQLERQLQAQQQQRQQAPP